LAARFGAENVFFDEASLEPGTKWLGDIRSRSSTSAVFLAVVGPRWAAIMADRADEPEEDQVRAELEAALRRDSKVAKIIPVLVMGATMPRESDLHTLGSVRQLLKRQAVELRPSQWDSDVAALIERIEPVEPPAQVEPPAGAEPPEETAPEPAENRPPRRSRDAASVAAPRQGHYEELVDLLLDERSLVVPFLGADANSCDRTEPWRDAESGYPPDAEELAAYLALKLDPSSEPPELAKISQKVLIAIGEGDLHLALRSALPSRQPPGSVHRFLASYPALTQRLVGSELHQLIVTTNYDDSLERAFDDAEEPYDLAVYIARGPDKGRFVHLPHDGEPQVIADANSYNRFPIDANGRVERTVIMKIHGAVDHARGSYAWRNNYVITEDDYIDYMRVADVESIVPLELLGNLRDYSHFLFLGHSMRDWSLRVFLKRIFGERQQPPNTSWAIQRDPTWLDDRFWGRIGVELSAISLEAYVRELGESLARQAGGSSPAQVQP